MPLFFIIAGMFISSWIKRPLKEAVSQKILRLLIPYFFWSFITALSMQIASNYTNNGLGIKDFLLSPIVPFSQYWFLYVLFFIHIIYYVLANIKICNGRLLFFILSIILYLVNPLIQQIWIFKGLCNFMIFFSIGSYIVNFINLRNFKCRKIIGPIIIFLLINLVYIKIMYLNIELLNYYFWFFTSIIGSGFCFLLSYFAIRWVKQIKNILCFFGKKSMEIYCIHLLILAGIRILLLKILNFNELWFVVIISGGITLMICYIVFSKIPYEKTKAKLLFGVK